MNKFDYGYLAGPYGSGKDTLAGIIGESIGLIPVSLRNLLIQSGYAKIVESGAFVQDSLVFNVLQNAKHSLVNGFPRTEMQCQYVVQNSNRCVLIVLECTDEILRERIGMRSICGNCQQNLDSYMLACETCGGPKVKRFTDMGEVLENRIQSYRTEVEPLIRECMRQVPSIQIHIGNNGIEETKNEVKKILSHHPLILGKK